jgi:hypothetical protein
MTDDYKEALDKADKELNLNGVAWESNSLFINAPIDYRDNCPMLGTYLPLHKTIQVRNRLTKQFEPKDIIQFCPVILTTNGTERKYIEILDGQANGYRVRSVHADSERFDLQAIKDWLMGENEEWTFEKIYLTIRNKLSLLFEFGDEREKDLIVCWIIGTYFHRQFNTYPYLFINGTKQVGKTKLLTFLYHTCFNAVFTLSQTPANLFRMTQELFPTFLLDETEKFGKKDENDYRSLLLSRYKKGASIYRQEDTKKDGVVSKTSKRFEVYGPTALANISGLDDVLEDRVIGITLIRSKNKAILNSKIDEFSSEWSLLRAQLYFLYLKTGKLTETLSNNQPIATDQMTDYTVKNNTPDDMMMMMINDDNDDMLSSPTIISGESGNIVSSVISSPLNIFNANVSGRSRELWYPLITVASYNGKTTVQSLLDLAVVKTNEKSIMSNDLNDEGMVLSGLWTFLKTHSALAYYLKDITTEVDIAQEKIEGNIDQREKFKPRQVMTILKRMGFKRAGKDAEGVKVLATKEQVLEIAERLGIVLEEK